MDICWACDILPLPHPFPTSTKRKDQLCGELDKLQGLSWSPAEWHHLPLGHLTVVTRVDG